jgi:hypothetical protein
VAVLDIWLWFLFDWVIMLAVVLDWLCITLSMLLWSKSSAALRFLGFAFNANQYIQYHLPLLTTSNAQSGVIGFGVL